MGRRCHISKRGAVSSFLRSPEQRADQQRCGLSVRGRCIRNFVNWCDFLVFLARYRVGGGTRYPQIVSYIHAEHLPSKR